MRRNHLVTVALSLMTMAFLYLPLIGVAVFSVNDARRGLVWKGFTLKWYAKLFANDWILEAAWNTLILAVVSTIIATSLGTVLAIAMDRSGSRAVGVGSPSMLVSTRMLSWSSSLVAMILA